MENDAKKNKRKNDTEDSLSFFDGWMNELVAAILVASSRRTTVSVIKR